MLVSIKKLKRLDLFLLLFFLLAIAYRLYACFQVPLLTTDVFRNLGYGSHAMENNFTIYQTRAINFKPEPWSVLWPDITYTYPPAALVFFYTFSIFQLGIFWVKLTLTIIDLFCAYLFYRHVSKLAATLFFCAPVSLWYTSHEGQFEALETLLIILSVLTIRAKQWRIAGFLLAISFQVKIWGILVVPWLLYEAWRSRSHPSFTSLLGKVAQGVVLGFIPFLPYYLQKPDLLLTPFKDPLSHFINFNPFTWNPLATSHWTFYWFSFWTYMALIALVIAGIDGWKKRHSIFSLSPLASFLVILKSLKWAQFWYLIAAPGFLFCFLPQRKLIHLLLVIYIMHSLDSPVLIIKERSLGNVIGPQIHLAMESCLFTCNVK